MKKIVIILSISMAFAANSPFNRVRVASYNQDGEPKEEIIDLSICLERNLASSEKQGYEEVIGYYADGLYEVSNGGNYLGNVVIYTGGRYCPSTTITWKSENIWPGASGSFSYNWGGIAVSDNWDGGDNHLQTDSMRFDFGMALTHETVHYFYGLDDEYAKTRIPFLVTADPVLDKITIVDNRPDYRRTYQPTEFQDRLSPFVYGTPVVFLPLTETSTIPLGLSGGHPYGDGTWIRDYATIDQVWDNSKEGTYSFNLKDPNGNRVDIRDEGIGEWTFDLPEYSFFNGSSVYAMNRIRVANSIMHYQYDVAKSRGCSPNGIDDIQWQWANLSTEFNINPYSAQGICCRVNGKPSSGWDVVSRNPIYDRVFGVYPGNDFRYWFKSLRKRRPTAQDVFSAKSYLMNYNQVTGKVFNGYAVWLYDGRCGQEKTYELPYMKVELAGRSQTEYRNDTHKYLNIKWVDRPKIETIVLIDASNSMNNGDKLSNAKQAAKYVSQAFLSADPNYDVSNISVGVYAFNGKVSTVHAFANNPSAMQINDEIDAITTSGATSLYDALYTAINTFSLDDPSSMKIMYVISDGLDNMSKKTRQEIIDLYKSKDISIHTIAYGSNADRKLLSSMAAETGGMYFEEEDGFTIKVLKSIAPVLSSAPGNTQIASGMLSPSQISADIHIPQRAQRVRVYVSYSGENSQSPIAISSQGNSAISVSTTSNVIGNTTFFTAEIDSATLTSITSSTIRVESALADEGLDYMVVVTGEYQEHSVNATLAPEGLFEWPAQKHFVASVRGLDGPLTGVSVTGKLISPNGSVQDFVMVDDGTSGDFKASDGLYFANLPTISANGAYQWEITMSNQNRTAHTSREGRFISDTVPFVEKVDSIPFEFVKSGQFIVMGCCSDEPMDKLVKISPENPVYAYLQPRSDTDRFEIVSTLAGKSYLLMMSSLDMGSFDRVEVYSPSNPSQPIYFVNVEQSGSGSVSIPLSAEYAKPGNIISVVGMNSVGANYDLLLLEKDAAEFAVGRFEVASDWGSLHTTLSLDTERKSEGLTSLVSPAGWKIIESRNISTVDFEVVGEKMSVDVFVPSTTQNQYWVGNLELWLYIPSSNMRIQLGEQIQLQPYFGNWKSYEFDVPLNAREKLSELHDDVHFQIVLNSADSLWIDNLRFVGNVADNPVNKAEPQCPEDSGCNPARPIVLRVNESIRVASEGELWIEITGFPDDWTPASVALGISAEDGGELIGGLSYDGGIYGLSGWYMEKYFGYVRGNRYLIRLQNIGNRPYRLNAWVSGQAMDVAAMDFIYKVNFFAR
ncbi:VWA domain-containing protein [Fibrobacter sp. UWCM]|uniref:VWA domain-containing protein n=1 Tax=Fibrobacter sp. UWCM TaxID=1896208 RepID=UPI0009F93741|nr:VWA domain-containing protein [Fibrobacter sp. UWCM]